MSRRAIHGFGALAALVLLVLLAILAATVVRISFASQSVAAQSVQGARAVLAARSGIDWGLAQVLQGAWRGCSPARSQTLDLRPETGMRVSVSCSLSSYNEGADADGAAQTLRVIELRAVACNGAAASCPDNGAAVGSQYVERLRVATVAECVTAGGASCP